MSISTLSTWKFETPSFQSPFCSLESWQPHSYHIFSECCTTVPKPAYSALWDKSKAHLHTQTLWSLHACSDKSKIVDAFLVLQSSRIHVLFITIVARWQLQLSQIQHIRQWGTFSQNCYAKKLTYIPAFTVSLSMNWNCVHFFMYSNTYLFCMLSTFQSHYRDYIVDNFVEVCGVR